MKKLQTAMFCLLLVKLTTAQVIGNDPNQPGTVINKTKPTKLDPTTATTPKKPATTVNHFAFDMSFPPGAEAILNTDADKNMSFVLDGKFTVLNNGSNSANLVLSNSGDANFPSITLIGTYLNSVIQVKKYFAGVGTLWVTGIIKCSNNRYFLDEAQIFIAQSDGNSQQGSLQMVSNTFNNIDCIAYDQNNQLRLKVSNFDEVMAKRAAANATPDRWEQFKKWWRSMFSL